VRYVLIDVGCLECGEPTAVVGCFSLEEGMRRLRAAADERLDWEVVGGQGTAVAMAGSGGSYWYPLQLHALGEDDAEEAPS
jgi:hypothetical protein